MAMRGKKGHFSLDRCDFEFEKVWFQQNETGNKNYGEKIVKPYGIFEILEKWRERHLDNDFPKEVLNMMIEGKFEQASDFHFGMIASSLNGEIDDKCNIQLYMHSKYSLEANIMLIFCVDFYIYLTNKRDKYDEILTQISNFFLHVQDTWGVDFITKLQDKAEEIFLNRHTSPMILEEIENLLNISLEEKTEQEAKAAQEKAAGEKTKPEKPTRPLGYSKYTNLLKGLKIELENTPNTKIQLWVEDVEEAIELKKDENLVHGLFQGLRTQIKFQGDVAKIYSIAMPIADWE